MCRLLDVIEDDVRHGLALADETADADLRTAVTSALLSRHGISTIVSGNPRFNGLAGLQRLSITQANRDPGSRPAQALRS